MGRRLGLNSIQEVLKRHVSLQTQRRGGSFEKHSILIMSLTVKEMVWSCKLTPEPNQQSFIPLISLSDLPETQLYHKNNDDAHCQSWEQGIVPRVITILFSCYLVNQSLGEKKKKNNLTLSQHFLGNFVTFCFLRFYVNYQQSQMQQS